jgi:hypothetical protein
MVPRWPEATRFWSPSEYPASMEGSKISNPNDERTCDCEINRHESWIISLFRKLHSLFSLKKFPAPMCRESRRKCPNSRRISAILDSATGPVSINFPVLFPVSRESGAGDRFSMDCVASQNKNVGWAKSSALLIARGHRAWTISLNLSRALPARSASLEAYNAVPTSVLA